MLPTLSSPTALARLFLGVAGMLWIEMPSLASDRVAHRLPFATTAASGLSPHRKTVARLAAETMATRSDGSPKRISPPDA